MRHGLTRVDELVATLLPRVALASHLQPSQLLDEDVVPPAKVAAKVHALRELVRRGGRADDLLGSRINSSRDIAAHYIPLLRGDTVESLHVVGLDNRNAVRLMQCVCRGGISSCAVTPRDILRPLLLNACAAAVVVHNHPSGETRPSQEDLVLTERIARGAEVLGVRLLDHIIVGDGSHFSFVDSGLLITR
jgi:DNA repair protein RadC